MGQKFKDAVNMPYKRVLESAKILWHAKATDAQTEDERTAKEAAWRAGAVTAVPMAFLLWLAKYVALDNHLIRLIERGAANKKVAKNKKGKDKTWQVLMKKYPDLSAHLIYYMMIVLIIGAANVTGYDEQFKDAIDHKVREWKTRRATSDLMKTKLDPQSPDFINQCIALENITSIAIIYVETYFAQPTINPGEDVYTDGFGMTWSRDANGHMKIRNYTDTKANRLKGRTPHKPSGGRDVAMQLEDTQQFLRDYVYPEIKRYVKREITPQEFIALCMSGYQYVSQIDNIAAKLNSALLPQSVADAFVSQSGKKWGGTQKRRWVAGMLAAGYINMNDILNANVDAFYNVGDINVFVRNGHFVCDANTVEYIMNMPGDKKVIDVVNSLQDGQMAIKQMGGQRGADMAKTVYIDDDEDTRKASESMGILVDAQRAYDKKNYKRAVALYEKAIKENPDNMEAYSSLAVAYIRLGEENNSLEYFEKATEIVVLGNKRMNLKMQVLYDSEIKAASYYNAGLAREKMAEFYESQGNFETARENYDMALKNYKTALKNAEKSDNRARIIMYGREIQRLQQKLNGVVASFKRGKDKIESAVDTRGQGIAPIYVDDKQNA